MNIKIGKSGVTIVVIRYPNELVRYNRAIEDGSAYKRYPTSTIIYPFIQDLFRETPNRIFATGNNVYSLSCKISGIVTPKRSCS